MADSETDVRMAALALSSMALAVERGGVEGPWLEDFRSQILRGIKNSHSEGLTPEGELTAIEAAVRLVDGHIEAARVAIRRAALQGSRPLAPPRSDPRPPAPAGIRKVLKDWLAGLRGSNREACASAGAHATAIRQSRLPVDRDDDGAGRGTFQP